jgi:cyclin-dependent kinase 7
MAAASGAGGSSPSLSVVTWRRPDLSPKAVSMVASRVDPTAFDFVLDKCKDIIDIKTKRDCIEVELAKLGIVEPARLKSTSRKFTVSPSWSEFDRTVYSRELGSGSFGAVYTTEVDEFGSAIKSIKMDKIDFKILGIDYAVLREIACLRLFMYDKDPKNNIIPLQGDGDLTSLFKRLIKKGEDLDWSVSPLTLRCSILSIATQLVNGFSNIYSHNGIHRDFKPQNVIVTTCHSWISDLGFMKLGMIEGLMNSKKIQTLWYRAPEVMLVGTGKYDFSVDVWSLGLVLGQLATPDSILRGSSELDQLKQILSLTGLPEETSEEWIYLNQFGYFKGSIDIISRSYLIPERGTWKTRVKEFFFLGRVDIPDDYQELVCSCLELLPSKRPRIEQLTDLFDLPRPRELEAFGMNPISEIVMENRLAAFDFIPGLIITVAAIFVKYEEPIDFQILIAGVTYFYRYVTHQIQVVGLSSLPRKWFEIPLFILVLIANKIYTTHALDSFGFVNYPDLAKDFPNIHDKRKFVRLLSGTELAMVNEDNFGIGKHTIYEYCLWFVSPYKYLNSKAYLDANRPDMKVKRENFLSVLLGIYTINTLSHYITTPVSELREYSEIEIAHEISSIVLSLYDIDLPSKNSELHEFILVHDPKKIIFTI